MCHKKFTNILKRFSESTGLIYVMSGLAYLMSIRSNIRN